MYAVDEIYLAGKLRQRRPVSSMLNLSVDWTADTDNDNDGCRSSNDRSALAWREDWCQVVQSTFLRPRQQTSRKLTSMARRMLWWPYEA